LFFDKAIVEEHNKVKRKENEENKAIKATKAMVAT
jgi:hypothetical protein